MKALALCALLALGACAPWWPERLLPYAAPTQGEAVACVETVLRDQRLRSGEKWEVFQHDDERFTRWRYEYPDRQRSAPTYLATYDELTTDILGDGRLRIKAFAWHRHGNAFKGFYNEDKAPGPAAHRAAAQVEEKCS